MSKENTLSIYFRLKKGEITKEKAASLLLEELFTNRYYFNLHNLSEDDLSSFLIWVYPKIIKSFSNFNDTMSIFTTYFTTVIRCQKNSWLREITKKAKKQAALDHHQFLETYSLPEEELYTGEAEFEYDSKEKLSKPEKPVKLNEKQSNTLLILAMRSYANLQHAHIKKIPELIGIDENKFLEYLNIMADKTSKNKENLEKAYNRLNSSYILCNQYTKELENMEEDITQYKIVQKKLNSQKQLLKMRQEQTKNYAKNMTPKVSTIARTLNRQTKYIHKILKDAESNIKDIKQILDPEEA